MRLPSAAIRLGSLVLQPRSGYDRQMPF